jgi:prepilin-type processing-associated H-X9-DG protein
MHLRIASALGTLAVFTGLLAAPAAPAAAPQNKPAPAATPAADALVVYSAGMEAMLVDPRDAGLVRALKMLDERIGELPRELDEDEIPAPAIQLALQLLMGPMSLRGGLLNMDGGEPNGPPFYAQLSFYGNAETTADLAGRVGAMLIEHGAPAPQDAPNMPGMQMIDADGVPVFLGTAKGDAAHGGSAFVVAVNKTANSDLTIDPSGLPNGVKPAFAFTLDAKELQPVVEMMLAEASEDEAQIVKQQLALSGLYGPNASRISVVTGQGKDRAHTFMRYTHLRKIMADSGLLPDGGITEADLKRIPADASCAQVSRMNLQGTLQMLKDMAQQAMQAEGQEGDPFQMVQEAIGIHPQRDLVDHLGQTAGMYMSDATGGGGLASLVGFIAVKNPDGLNQTIARLRGMANQLSQQHARGYVRIAERDVNGHKIMTVLFPGLPVPLEISWAMADGYLYAAGSPNALLAAMHQGKSASKDITHNDRFKEMGGSHHKDAIQIRFIDTPRLIGQGYGLVSMGASALANAVRSPTDLKRDPGFIMPSYQELMKDAKATVMIARFEGDDMILTAEGDRSLLVNACGMAGAIGGAGGAATVAALAAGVVTPSMSQARAAAEDARAAAMLRNLGMACMMHAADNNDRLPDSFDDLLKAGYLEKDTLASPFGPSADGKSDYWLNPRGGTMSEIADPARFILAYDRAMYVSSDKVAVVFADGHVEVLDTDAFVHMTQDDQYAGTNFDLPFGGG